MATARKATPVFSPEDKHAVLLRRIAVAKAKAWIAEPGDMRTGQVVAVRIGDGEFGIYPILVLADVDENGTVLDSFYTFHAFHGLAAKWVVDNQPAIGAVVTIQSIGKVEGHKVDKEGNPNKYYDYFMCFGDGSDLPEEEYPDLSAVAEKLAKQK